MIVIGEIVESLAALDEVRIFAPFRGQSFSRVRVNQRQPSLFEGATEARFIERRSAGGREGRV